MSSEKVYYSLILNVCTVIIVNICSNSYLNEKGKDFNNVWPNYYYKNKLNSVSHAS